VIKPPPAPVLLLVFLVLGPLLLATPVSAAADLSIGQGLFPVRNFQPIQGLLLQMSGDSAVPARKGELFIRLNVAETATILQEQSATVNVALKLNQLRSTLDVRYGLLANTEIGLELSSLYNNSGGLDGLIVAVEHILDKPAPIRERLKNSGFAYIVTKNGQTLIHGTNESLGLTDTTLSSKTLLVPEQVFLPAIAIRTALKLPTGDKSRAFGTGVVDLAIGIALQKTLFGRIVVYQNLNGVLPTGHYLGFGLRAYVTSVTGVEWVVTPKFSITGQFDYYQSPFHNTGIRVFDRAVTEGVLGLGYRFSKRLLWQIYAVENFDLTRDVAPDFTLATALTYRFGGL
jgi:uncharacterized protein DUF3187